MGEVGVLMGMILVGRENAVILEWERKLLKRCPHVGERECTRERRMAVDWRTCPCSLVTEYFATDLGR